MRYDFNRLQNILKVCMLLFKLYNKPVDLFYKLIIKYEGGIKMFEKLTFSSGKDKIEFDKYITIRGKYLFQQVYEYICNITNDECKYSDLSSCIRYDKTLRDTLYKYLATFEEYLRAQIFDRYEIKREFRLSRKEKDYIKKMARQIYESQDKESSELYKKFKLDLGETIELVKEIKMFDKEKYKEFDEIRVVRNAVMHHNLLVLGKEQQCNKVEDNMKKIISGIEALANNLPEGYKINFIKEINGLRCDFDDYKLIIEG